MNMDHIWTATKDRLPNIDEKVLVISKFGNVSNALFTDYGLDQTPRFGPGGLFPDTDVKWWMPIPTDGWHDIKKDVPPEGTVALTMGMYGTIFSGKWGAAAGERTPMFHPYVRDVLYWREMPELPAGVRLSCEKKA